MERGQSRRGASRPRPRRLRSGRPVTRALSCASGLLAHPCKQSISAMPGSDFEVVVVGGGSAGVAAARRLYDVSIRCLLVEARPRLGGRAWTWTDASGFALDLGCGWLHSADRNPWVRVAEEQGGTIDKSAPAWMRPPFERSFPPAEYADYRKAFAEFYARLEARSPSETDAAASTLLDPGSRWNPLLNAMSTYISG